MLGYGSSRVWRRGHPLSHSALTDSSNRRCGGGEASVGDHGEGYLSGCGGTLNDGCCPRTTCRNELTWQQLDSLHPRGPHSRKLTRNQLDVELLRLRRRVLRVVTRLVDDLWTGGYRAIGEGHLRGG